MEVIQQSLYDFPKYYDLVFGSDWAAEFRFLLAIFEHYAPKKVRRLLEPACGTGRLLVRLADRGFTTAGLDLNPHAVAFCNNRFRRRNYAPPAVVADMSNFRLRDLGTRQLFDAAFNPINSFRHLPTEQAACDHLRCMANVLRTGGLYVLGLHLTPTHGERLTDEAWSARRGHLQVNSYLWSQGIDFKRRQERIGMTFDVYTPTRQFQIRDDTVFRTYTAGQMRSLLKTVDAFDIVETFDFTYNVAQPIQVGSSTEDVLYILRKR